MRKSIIMIVTAAAALTAGCSSDGAPSRDEQAAAIAAGEKTPEDAVFEDFVREEDLAANDADVEAMIELGQAICQAYDEGHDFVEIIKVATDVGFSGREAGQLNGAATAAYCPEHATP